MRLHLSETRVLWCVPALVTAMALWGGPGRSALGAEARGEGPPPAGRYKLLIVVAPTCADLQLPVLRRAPDSAGKLADAFRRLHYSAIVLSGKDATASNILDWLKRNANPQSSDLVILTLIGHGGERQGKPWFLTSEATQATGGLDLSKVNELATAGKWPLVMVVDACRLPLLPGKGPNIAGGAVFRGPTSRTGDVPRTQLFSTQPGEPAFDKHDLVTALADGLEIDPQTKRFRADPWFRVPGDQEGARGNCLSLFSWFLHAVTKIMVEHEMRQQAHVVPGIPDLDTLLAQPDPPGPPTAPPPARGPDLDLLELWRPQHGAYQSKASLDGYMWVINVPAEGAGNDPWLGGHVAELGEGFDTTGKAVFAELLASFSPFERWPPTEVTIGLDTKFVDEANNNSFVSSDGRKPRRVVATNRVTWCKVPLAPGKRLNYFAVTDLPQGCVLTLRRLFLGPAAQALPAEAERSVNVLARWWVGDAAQVDVRALRFTTEVIGGKRVLRVEAGTGWVGGVVGPPVFVSQGDTLEVAVENTSAAEAQVLLELKEDFTALARANLRLPPGRSLQRVSVNINGLVNYFAITKPAAALRIYSITLKPEHPAAAEPKQ